jgi:UDP-N-acetylglucosamine 1-carboxyvinyltransferase
LFPLSHSSIITPMSKYLITGGGKLSGTIQISGNKNSILPCLAASLLTDQEIILKNVPNISDVNVALDILKTLGADINRSDHQVSIKIGRITSHILPPDLVSKLRASVLFVGPLLSRMGKAEFSHPGGDVIGVRSIEAHLNGFRRFGYKVSMRENRYLVSKKELVGDVEIFLEEASVTATENLILNRVIGEGITTIKNAASEPHIIDLCLMLNKMGAKIEGIGTPTLSITAVKSLHGAEFKIGFDFMEMGTYSIAAAMTKGEILLKDCSLENMEAVINPLKRMGISFDEQGSGIKVSCKKLIAIPKLHTNIWPGFPTDLMSVMIVLSTQARGVSLLHDWMYESRMFFVDKLITMGANITVADPHRVLVSGPTRLTGRHMESPDIRAGMALVLAALVARGTSTINRAELIERGYEDVVENLSKLGAKIEKA